MAKELGHDYRFDVFPIFEVDASEDPVALTTFRGTAFLACDYLLVTCWHCVRDAAAGRELVIGHQLEDAPEWRLLGLARVAQDEHGTDLATANVNLKQGPAALEIARRAPIMGTPVWTMGYPDTTPFLDPETGRKKWEASSRVLHGYISRVFWARTPYGEIPSFEADMLAPAGISGAPLIETATREVVGVVYGSLSATTAERDIDPRSGEVLPSRQRTVAFAGAHYTSTLLEAAGPATDGRSLRQCIDEGGPVPPT